MRFYDSLLKLKIFKIFINICLYVVDIVHVFYSFSQILKNIFYTFFSNLDLLNLSNYILRLIIFKNFHFILLI